MNKVKFFALLGLILFMPKASGLSPLTPAQYASFSSSPGKVTAEINVPDFNIKEASWGLQEINIEGFDNLSDPGKPALPFKVLTLAIPPDAAVQSVEVNGTYAAIPGVYNIEPAPAMISLSTDFRRTLLCNKQYDTNKQITYSSNTPYPSSNGELVSTGGLRKYNLVNVAVYPLAYLPSKGELKYASHLQVVINYTKDTEKETEYARLASDNLADLEASELIYNFSQAKEWYPYVPAPKGKETYDYVIITTTTMAPYCTTLVNWKTALGYKVNVVTTDWINSNYTGVDNPQKMRNFLRDKYPVGQWGIKYVLIVGTHANIPMRMCYSQSNNTLPSWAIDAYDYPILTDLYYADLSNPDNTSWNKDGDSYWGEALTSGGSTGGNDSPDYVTEVSVGRIPWSNTSKIMNICNKIKTFEQNIDLTYKKKSLCAQSILQFSSTVDGASISEDMITDGILPSSSATRLYEKKGRVTSSYSCTDSLTKTNLKNRCQGMGILALCAHGWTQNCMRLIWATDNGDGVAQDGELAYPELLTTADVTALDDTHPANAFLQSCIVGHPETTSNLGASLLDKGCVSVVAASRSIFTNLGNPMQYYFFNKLLKDTTVSHSKTGLAFDISRQNYMSTGGQTQYTWATLLALNLYGDPSLCHFGTTVGIEETTPSNSTCLKIDASPNPFGKEITIKYSLPFSASSASLGVYDASGRLIKSFQNIKTKTSSVTWDASNCPAGVYFIRLKAGELKTSSKITLTK